MYVLIDANNNEIDWNAVSQNILGWVLSVGMLSPSHSDHLVASRTDLLLLFEYSRLLISDRLDYKEMCSQCGVPFILIDKHAKLGTIREWVDGVWNVRSGRLTDSSNSDLEYLGDVHIEAS